VRGWLANVGLMSQRCCLCRPRRQNLPVAGDADNGESDELCESTEKRKNATGGPASSEPGSPSRVLDDATLRKVQLTRKFTQLREEVIGDLSPDSRVALVPS